MSLRSPVYSPTSAAVRLVLSSSSAIHCRTATVFGVRISVARCTAAMALMPTMVLPAPQGSTTTPLPPLALPLA